MLESNLKIRGENGRVRCVVTQLHVKIWKLMKFSLRVQLTGIKKDTSTFVTRRGLGDACQISLARTIVTCIVIS